MQKIGFIYFPRGIVNHQFNSNLMFDPIILMKIKRYSLPVPFHFNLKDMNESSANFSIHSVLVFHFFTSVQFTIFKIFLRKKQAITVQIVNINIRFVHICYFFISLLFSRLYYRALSHGHINSVLHYGRSYTPM